MKKSITVLAFAFTIWLLSTLVQSSTVLDSQVRMIMKASRISQLADYSKIIIKPGCPPFVWSRVEERMPVFIFGEQIVYLGDEDLILFQIAHETAHLERWINTGKPPENGEGRKKEELRADARADSLLVSILGDNGKQVTSRGLEKLMQYDQLYPKFQVSDYPTWKERMTQLAKGRQGPR